MSRKNLLLSVIVVVCGIVGIYLYAFHLIPGREARPTSPRQAASQAAPSAPEPARAPAPASQQSVADLYRACVDGPWPTREDAQARNAACSQALQTRQLKPAEIALARLTRGVARTALGDKVLASEDYTDALKHYDGAIDPSKPDALDLYRRAAALGALGQTDKALSDYSEAIRIDPQSPLAFLGRGVLLATRKRAYDRAVEDFTKVLAIEPDNVDALIARGNAYSQLGDNGRALADLDRAISLAPKNAQAYLIRGLAHNRRNETKLALDDYDTALKLEPKFAAALANRAAIEMGERKYDDAIRDLDASIAIEPNNPVGLYNRGFAHFAKGDYDKALADYSAAIDLDPTMGLAFNNRCLVRAIMGKDLVDALKDCDTAQKLMPLNQDVRDTRGFIYLKLGDPALAAKEYDAALDVDPNRPLALYGRGLARLRMGQTREGEQDQAAALALNPEVASQFEAYGVK